MHEPIWCKDGQKENRAYSLSSYELMVTLFCLCLFSLLSFAWFLLAFGHFVLGKHHPHDISYTTTFNVKRKRGWVGKEKSACHCFSESFFFFWLYPSLFALLKWKVCYSFSTFWLISRCLESGHLLSEYVFDWHLSCVKQSWVLPSSFRICVQLTSFLC